MTSVTLLLPTKVAAATAAIAADVFGAAMSGPADSGASDHRLHLATVDGEPARGISGRPIPVDSDLSGAGPSDVVWVASSWGDADRVVEENLEFLPWLRARHAEGATIAGISDATFLLAAAGLLDGRAATVRPALAPALRSRYPQVDVRPLRPLVDAGRVCTASGLGSGCDLLVTLVRRHFGTEISRAIGSWLLVDMRRDYDATGFAFDAQRDHGDALVLEIQRWLETNFSDPVTLCAVAERFAVSPRTLTRRFHAATGELPSDYLQRVRVETARDMLRRTALSVHDVMVRVGYQDRGAFLAAFRRHVGGVPQDERRVAT